MNRAAIIILLLFVGSWAIGQQVRLELRLLEANPGIGSSSVTEEESGKMYLLSKEGVRFYGGDIASSRIVEYRSGPKVEVSFTPTAAGKLYDFTARWVEQRLGILVSGKLVFVGTIGEPMQELTLTGLKPERAQGVALSIGGGKLSPRPPMKRSVFVDTETNEPGIQRKKLSYVVLPTDKGAENAQAVLIISECMAEAGYSVLAVADLKGFDPSKVGIVNLSLKDLQYETMTIEIGIGKFRGSPENPNPVMIWRGVLGLDTQFYSKFRQLALRRAISYYSMKDVHSTDAW